ncbi:MAG: 6-carboxytetrahydropterin synthase QueD [Elusimicrobia bacterium HGW-Elusimicrobia-2]|nr:MAG: 6-carboxytetrahydropterin synthase QueD [Elusimicrobia bacterium HGW-Elusimicrobia-2]
MYRIFVKDHFSSAHYLRDYKGKCENLHGHNWGVTAEVSSVKLKNAMVMDFKDLKDKLKRVIMPLDHILLNDLRDFKKLNPTSENIARYIFKKLAALLPAGVCLEAIKISETDNNIASYSRK